MDLSSLDTRAASNKGAKIELRHPVTKEGLGNYVHMLGKDSDAFRAFISHSANADRRREFESKRKGKPAEPKTFAESEAEGIALIVACTTGFSCDDMKSKDGKSVVEVGGDFLRLPGGNVSYSEAAATKLFTDYPEAFRQMNDALQDLENFMK
jgi:hypothetical protein